MYSVRSLQADDPVRKSLLTLAIQLKIIEERLQLVTSIIPKQLEPTTKSTAIPTHKPVTPSSMVQSTDTKYSRVSKFETKRQYTILIQNLQQHSQQLKNTF